MNPDNTKPEFTWQDVHSSAEKLAQWAFEIRFNERSTHRSQKEDEKHAAEAILLLLRKIVVMVDTLYKPKEYGSLFSLVIPCNQYNPLHNFNDPAAGPEYTGPRVPVTVEDVDGLRVILGGMPLAGFAVDKRPNITIERQTTGNWTIFVHPNDGDAFCRVEIHDRGAVKVYKGDGHEDDLLHEQVLEIVSPRSCDD